MALGLIGAPKGEQPMVKLPWGLGVMGMAVLVGVGICVLGASGSAPKGLDRVAFIEREPTPAWVQRIALVDAALGRSDRRLR